MEENDILFIIYIAAILILRLNANKQQLQMMLRMPDPISCRKWDVSYLTTLKKKNLIFMLHTLQFIPTIH